LFSKIQLENFRTHVNTELALGDVTLLIGSNNAGKSNLIAGINHFSRLIARGRPADGIGNARNNKDFSRKKVQSRDFFPHRHRLAKNDDSMGFYCEWLRIPLESISHSAFVRSLNPLLLDQCFRSEAIIVRSEATLG